MGTETTRTYQTRFKTGALEKEILGACANHFSHVKHRLFADIASGKKANQLKNDYLVKYQITARQFNAIKVQIEGKIDSIKSRREEQILEKQAKIDSLRKSIKRLSKNKKNAALVHQKKRRLHTLEKQHLQLKEDHAKGVVHLCFGSKKLFHAQFNLEENGYSDHEEWYKDWKKARTDELFFLGSKDETAGNQSCTAIVGPDQALSLRIRLPDALKEQYGKYLIIKNVTFAYGRQEVLKALANCSRKENAQAISWRLILDDKGWRAFATFAIQPTVCTSDKNLGAIGVDINVDHLALVEVDRFGNPASKKTIPFHIRDKTTNQAKAIIGDIAAEVISIAAKTGKPLVIEDLDFRKKKATLRENHNTPYARMLSSFAYRSLINHLKSHGSKKGVRVDQVNPAYTSLIGQVKFAKRYGLTIHQAAALTIARRFLKYSERPPSSPGEIPTGKGDHVTLVLPERNRTEHVWSFWSKVRKKLKVALRERFRKAKYAYP